MTHGCHEVSERLQDWMDGTLEAPASESFRSHLEECASCRDELAAFESLREAAGRLPSELRPQRDLWPAIEMRLELPWWKRLADSAISLWEIRPATSLLTAGAALLALALGIWLWRAEPAPSRAAPVIALEEPARTAPTLEAQAQLARSEDGVLLPHRDLLEAVQRQRDHLEPETVAILEENMRIIDQAIGQIRSALEDDPLNQQLHRLLAAHYQQEVQLLKRVSRA